MYLKENLHFKEFLLETNDIIYNVMYSNKTTMSIFNEKYTVEDLQKRIKKLDIRHLKLIASILSQSDLKHKSKTYCEEYILYLIICITN